LIGVVLVAHMHIASETKAAVEYILQQQEAFVAVDVVNSDDVAVQSLAFHAILKNMAQDCDAILVMTDIFGATPCNMAIHVMMQGDIPVEMELVAGFNIPSVIKAILERQHLSLEDLAQFSLDAGQKYLRLGSQEAVLKRMCANNKVA